MFPRHTVGITRKTSSMPSKSDNTKMSMESAAADVVVKGSQTVCYLASTESVSCLRPTKPNETILHLIIPREKESEVKNNW